MRYILTLLCLLFVSTAQADEVSDAIVAKKLLPNQVLPCTEKSTQKSGLCGIFHRPDGTTYLAFQVRGKIVWVKRIPKDGEATLVYTAGRNI